MKKTWLRFVPPISALLCALGIATVFSACGMKEDGSWMRCHDAQTLSFWISLALSALLTASAFLPGRTLPAVLYLLSLGGCTVLFLVPGNIIPMCMMNTMRCYTLMQPFIRMMSVLTALTILIPLLRPGMGK